MNYKRREFLRLTANVAAASMMVPLADKLALSGDDKKKPVKFGLQLYSLRADMPKDPTGVLKQVASYGYNYVESYEHDKLGMFWGMNHTDFKKYIDDLGLTIYSSHCNTDKDFDKKAADAAAIGMKYLIYPYEGAKKTIDDYKKFADDFNKKGEVCKKNGIRFAFHNHDFSFVAQNGEFPEDVLLKNTDPALVDFQMDIYWVVTAGQDPEAWMKKYPGRFKLCHVKDRIKNTGEREATCVLGEGSINFPKILKTGQGKGLEYFIVEHERYDNTTPLKAAEADAVYMKNLKI